MVAVPALEAHDPLTSAGARKIASARRRDDPLLPHAYPVTRRPRFGQKAYVRL
jgi:hypothetical protein